jgi:3-methylcrotonyl-CoA carboxylase alpha subunit
VEHPVTEAITGLDLVQLQLRIAAGEPLALEQADVGLRGHAVECRVYAEDARRLLPQSGRLVRYREPSAAGIRIDAGVREGQTITVYYDALLAKLIAHGDTRTAALDGALAALRQYEILGVRHNIAFLLALLSRPEVRANTTDTHFIDAHLADLALPPPSRTIHAAAALAAISAAAGQTGRALANTENAAHDPWLTLGPVAW